MKLRWDAVAWWELRRIPFNLLILVVGLVSGSIVLLSAGHFLRPDVDFGTPFLGIALYGLAANLCYTLGWVTELLGTWGNTEQAEKIRPKIFRAGLVFSAGLTLLPAIVLPLIWAIQRFR